MVSAEIGRIDGRLARIDVVGPDALPVWREAQCGKTGTCEEIVETGSLRWVAKINCTAIIAVTPSYLWVILALGRDTVFVSKESFGDREDRSRECPIIDTYHYVDVLGRVLQQLDFNLEFPGADLDLVNLRVG